MAKELDYFGIRECIAESGKSKVSDMKAYVLHRYPNVDKKLLAWKNNTQALIKCSGFLNNLEEDESSNET